MSLLKSRPIWLLMGLLMVAAGFYAWKSSRRSGSELHFETVKADRGRVVSKVTATGTLSALVTVQVGSQVSGRIAELKVDFNSQVKKGDVLARIDPQLFDAALEQARANYLAAQSNKEKAVVQAADAKRQAQRAATLLSRQLIAQADFETIQANADVARAQVSAAQGNVLQAQAALHQAQVNLAYTTIASPINGVVISRSVDVGQTVAASLQAPTLFVIAEDLRQMQVDTNVSEADIGKVKAGMAASFTVDAFPSQRFKGTLRQIRSAPLTVQNVVTYDAVIDVANPELELRPGMTANVTFVSAEKDDALRVPNAALRFRPPPELLAAALAAGRGGEHRSGVASAETGSGEPAASARGAHEGGGRGPREGMTPDRKRLYVLRGELPVPVEVKTGISDGSLTEIVEGELQEGEPIVTEVSGGAAARPGSTGPAGLGGPGGGMRRVF